jgi:protein-S-isoprenylcysteine O-methyltransferase Ste14
MAATAPITGRPDTGRLLMIPTAGVLVLLDVLALSRAGRSGPLVWLSDTLTAVFYVLIIWCYLRRGPALATSRSVTGHIAAVTGTLTPLAVPLLHGGQPGTVQLLAADLLLVTGSAWSVWSLRTLGTNLSVLAQARSVVTAGPYRLCRHPLYTGEIISTAGVALAAGTSAAAAAWLGFCLLQAYRALREEQLLREVLPGYAEYRSRTSALIPGLLLVPAVRRRAGARAAGRTSDAYTTTLLR